MRKPVDIVAQSALKADRRTALRIGLGGLAFAAGALALKPRRAAGFTLQEADAPTAAAFHNSCGQVAYHQKLAEEVRSILVARHLPEAARPQSIVCPICGCPVTV